VRLQKFSPGPPNQILFFYKKKSSWDLGTKIPNVENLRFSKPKRKPIIETNISNCTEGVVLLQVLP